MEVSSNINLKKKHISNPIQSEVYFNSKDSKVPKKILKKCSSFPHSAGDYVQAALTLQRAAYRRANGGSRAPSLTEDAALRYAEGAAQLPKAF